MRMHTDLKEIGEVAVPGNPGLFQVADFIRAGTPEFAGVGPKLAEAIAGESVSHAAAATVRFFLSEEGVSEYPRTLFSKRRQPVLNWWSLYCALRNPPGQLLMNVPNGTQIGCLVWFSTGERAIRNKVNWDTGHNIGGVPTDSPWTWNPGTVFAIPDDL